MGPPPPPPHPGGMHILLQNLRNQKKKRKDPWGTPLNKLIYALESICYNINTAQHTTSMMSNMLCWMLILPQNLGNQKKKRKDPWGTPLNKPIYALESTCCNINKAQHTTLMLSSMLCWMLILQQNLGNQKKKKKRSMGHPLKKAYICIGIDMLQHQHNSTHNIDVEQHALLDAHFTTKFGEPKKKKKEKIHGAPP